MHLPASFDPLATNGVVAMGYDYKFMFVSYYCLPQCIWNDYMDYVGTQSTIYKYGLYAYLFSDILFDIHSSLFRCC